MQIQHLQASMAMMYSQGIHLMLHPTRWLQQSMPSHPPDELDHSNDEGAKSD
jgi:hypothetical protein